MISPAGKRSASGEARYSVTPFKEAETDLPPEAYAPSGAAPPPLIRTPLLTPAETCLKKPCTSVRSFMAVGMDGFDRLLEKLQPHLAEFQTQA